MVAAAAFASTWLKLCKVYKDDELWKKEWKMHLNSEVKESKTILESKLEIKSHKESFKKLQKKQ